MFDQFQHNPEGPRKDLSPRRGVPCQFVRACRGTESTKYEEVILAHQITSSRDRDLRHSCLGSVRTYHDAERKDHFHLEPAGQIGGPQFHGTFLSGTAWSLFGLDGSLAF